MVTGNSSVSRTDNSLAEGEKRKKIRDAVQAVLEKQQEREGPGSGDCRRVKGKRV